MRVEERIIISAPIAQVFAAVTDPRRTTEWNENVLEVRDIADGPPGVGSTWTQITSVMGRPVTLQCRVAEFSPPEKGLLVVSGAQQGTVLTHCSEVPDGTELMNVLDFQIPGGMLGQLAGGFVASAVRGELTKTMCRQKEVLEAEKGAAGGSRSSG